MKKKNYLSLTHWINETTPSYGNQGGFTRSSLSAIKDGRTANSEQWGFNNHLGTHIDFPKHFDDKGLSSSDYDNPFFVYDQVGIIVLEKAVLPGHLIVLEEIVDQVKSLPVSTEILLLKTHFEEYRGQDIYWKQNPGYEEALAVLFREHFTSLKAFGFDRGVTVQGGLTVPVTTTAHGSAFAIAGKNEANLAPILNSFKIALSMAENKNKSIN